MGLDLQLVEVEKNLPAKLSEVWPLVEKARVEFGIPQTTVEIDLGNLQFSGETPITWMSQCAAQAEKKASALYSAYWRLKKAKIKLRKLREKGDERSNLEADEIEAGMVNGEHYIKTAYKDLVHYQKTMEILRLKHNIPEEISEQELSENSKKEHIRKSMRQALRDMESHGRISNGVSEHLEHYGIHPMTARVLIDQYRATVQNLLSEGKVPTMEHLLSWLDKMEELLLPGANEQLKYMGLQS